MHFYQSLSVLHPPKGIADDEEGDVEGVGVGENVIRLGLDHITVSDDNFLAIKCFLRIEYSPCQPTARAGAPMLFLRDLAELSSLLQPFTECPRLTRRSLPTPRIEV